MGTVSRLPKGGGISVNAGIPQAINVVLALLALIFLSPLFLVLVIAIRRDSDGPVLASETRVGRGGRRFSLHKLRTTTGHAGARLTKVGQRLRRWKLDSLPQLLNVLRGDMALVGPRPELPRFVNMAEPVWQQVLVARPGIADPVVVSYGKTPGLQRELESDPEGVYRRRILPRKLDGYVTYLSGRNFFKDLWVLVKGLFRVPLPRRGPDLIDDLLAARPAAKKAPTPPRDIGLDIELPELPGVGSGSSGDLRRGQ